MSRIVSKCEIRHLSDNTEFSTTTYVSGELVNEQYVYSVRHLLITKQNL